MVRVMRSIRDSATLPDSSTLRGRKPQQTGANTIASNRGAKSSSNGQLMKTDMVGSVFRVPRPKCSRTPWATARHRSDARVQMARELGLNPKKFGSLASQRQELWKVPLAEFIAELYVKRFGKTRPGGFS